MALTQQTKTELYRFFAIAFDAAPGVQYMTQLADAVNSGMTVPQIVEVFTTKPQFTAVYPNFFSNNQFASLLVENVVGTAATTAAKAQAVADIEGALGAGWTRGKVIYQIFTNLAGKSFTDATWGATSHQMANQVAVAQYYTEVLMGDTLDLATLQAVIGGVTPTTDVSTTAAIQSVIHAALGGGTAFTLTSALAGTASVMHLNGDQDVRIDFTNPANQVRGLDLDGDGTIEHNGIENNITGVASNFAIVDAYARNPLNERDITKNFLGDIAYDGTGFQGDGVSTNGNIVLGGLGVDEIFGGIGNDFLTGGGIAAARISAALQAWMANGGTAANFVAPSDFLSGGRNADFFFVELSALDSTDGNNVNIDGGTTGDDNAAGTTQSAQDADWLLLEASDDDEPVTVTLRDDTTFDPGEILINETGSVVTRSGQAVGTLRDIENFDASGNMYGFLDQINVELGGRRVDSREVQNGTLNNGIGSSAQLLVKGSNVANIIVGGYDNDHIEGNDGNDLLMGGNLAYLINPNMLQIVNDGRDELIGGLGDDDIVFEADGGRIEGDAVINVIGAGNDTLWLTNLSLGTRNAATMTTDGVLRFDLDSQNIDTANGYGGADAGSRDGNPNDTQDQTNYAAGVLRTTVQDMDNVIATGLGAVDYDTDGSNRGDLAHVSQVNQLGYQGNLTLRGTSGDNILYANTGNDVIEGREGNDRLSGGEGDDDFVFSMQNDSLVGEDGNWLHSGDGVDVIHRQADVNGDNIWDGYGANPLLPREGTFSRDFGQVSNPITANSKLTLTLIDQVHPTDLTGFPVNGVQFKLDNVTYTVALASGVQSTYAAFTSGLNTALDANTTLARLNAVLNADNTITITDPNGKTFQALGYTFVNNIVPPAGDLIWNQTVGGPAVSQTQDRLIYRAYEDRADNEQVDDNSVTGSSISLGHDAYAEDLVINFAADGTRLAEDQSYRLTFNNLTTEDQVTVSVNGVTYRLTVGIDLDGNAIANEELVAQGGIAGSQATIQANFLGRLSGFINSFMDNDTGAGQVVSSASATTITLMQVAYNGEETVFMQTPVVTLGNQSGGETAKVVITNASQHEVHLLDFDGRNAGLNASNVLFVGDTNVSRAILATAANAGGTLNGTEAIVIDGGADNLESTVRTTGAAIANNTATNSFLATNFTVHGDDFLLGGTGADTINGGTGDDRVIGSLGTDVLDGGKSFYAVQVLGEAQARVYVLNTWEASHPTQVAALTGLTISSINRIADSENDGTGFATGVGTNEVYDDTLQFQQADFTNGTTRFTVTLNNYVVTGGVVELRNGGAGTVGVDVNGDGVMESTTTFTNFENVRTVSGIGNAVAGDGQGNDTLDVALLSRDTGGISYDLTNNLATAGQVMYSADAHASLLRPVVGDFESLVMRVDGVENVIGGLGDDLLTIDETEAAKNNLFNGGLGDDRIVYVDQFADDVNGVAVPTMTIKVNAAADTDTVTMTAGRVGQTVAVDTLIGVEEIALQGSAAEGSRENDVLDVTMMSSGAVVNYADAALPAGYGGAWGTVRDLAGNLQVVIEGLEEIENVWADGNDTVIVADADVMNNNTRSDENNGTAPVDIQLATFLDYDERGASSGTTGNRVRFINQTTGQITDVINQNQFTFDLSRVGSDLDTDTVDYSAETGAIAAVLNFSAGNNTNFVLVDGDNDGAYDDAESRVDRLISVEQIVAAQGPNSTIDLTNSDRDVNVIFSYNQPGAKTLFVEGQQMVSAIDRQINTVRVADAANQSAVGGVNLLEYRDLGNIPNATLPDQVKAVWENVQGSDRREYVELTQWEDGTNHFLNLRGGRNEVNYNERTNGIELIVNSVDATFDGIAHQFDLRVNHLDTNGVANGTTDTIRGFNASNTFNEASGVRADSMRIEASQGDRDLINVIGSNIFLLGEVETSGDAVVTAITDGTSQGLTMSGFEFLWDGTTSDTYTVNNLANFVTKLTLIDFNQIDTVPGGNIDFGGSTDRDTIKLTNGAFGTATIRPPVSHSITVSNNLHMGDLTANDLQWLGTNSNGLRQPLDDDGNLLTGTNSVGFDFRVLDISEVTNQTNITAAGSGMVPSGTDGKGDELIVGALNLLSTTGTAITGFSILSLTGAGAAYDFDLTASQLQTAANVKIVGFDALLNTLDLSRTTSADTVTVTNANPLVGATVIGSAFNDTITGAAGADVLRGNGGNDTLDGGFVPAVGEVQTVTLAGGAAVLAGAETLTITGVAGATIVVGASGSAAEFKVATTTADADQIGALLAGLTPAQLATELGYAAGSIASSAYDAAANTFKITFSGSVADQVDVAVSVTVGSTMTAAAAQTTAHADRTESADTYVFEATGAANGADTLNNVDVSDTFDFSAFLGAGNGGATAVAAGNAGVGFVGNVVAAATDLVTAFNKGTLSAADFVSGTTLTAGKFSVSDNDQVVFAVSADADGVADATIQSWNLYYVNNGAAVGAGDLTVTLVGTVNSAVELTEANLATML